MKRPKNKISLISTIKIYSFFRLNINKSSLYKSISWQIERWHMGRTSQFKNLMIKYTPMESFKKTGTFKKNTSGSASIQYGLIAAALAVVVAGAAQKVGSSLSSTLSQIGHAITGPSTNTGTDNGNSDTTGGQN
ncbi:MAG: Flp family type IVb pilin [Hyphomicrobiales bacterium]|nr:Flp family type IVb pilin [Hyphomicrobiales bacterium]